MRLNESTRDARDEESRQMHRSKLKIKVNRKIGEESVGVESVTERQFNPQTVGDGAREY